MSTTTMMKLKFDGKFKFLECLDGGLGERERVHDVHGSSATDTDNDGIYNSFF